MDFLKKRLPALMLAVLLLFSACGKAEEEENEEDDVVYVGDQVVQQTSAADNIFSVNYDPEAGINPISAQSANNMQFWSLMYDSIFVVENDFSVTSEVVTEYTTADNEWWVFYIDTSITFHDGTPLSAKDIAYSINRARMYPYYTNRLGLIYGCSAMGDDCFAISLSEPNSQLPSHLNIPIIKSGSVEEDVPLGTGPYMMDESGDKLIAYEGYRHYDSLPVDTVHLKDYMDTAAKISAFEASLIDVVTNDPTGMYNLGYGSSNETRYYETSNMHYIGFNFQSMYFSNTLARNAVAAAVDRDGIVDAFMENCAVPTVLPVHPVSPLYDKAYAEGYGFDAERSQILFSNYGIKDYDADGVLEIMITGIVVEIDINFIVNTDSTAKLEAARKIAETINEMGIKVTLHELKWEDYVERLEKGDYDMYYGEVRMNPDWDLSYLFKPYTVYRDPEKTQKGMNYAQCFDEQYVNTYAAYLGAAEEDRFVAFSNVSKLIMENAAIVPICFERQELLTHRGVISGISCTQFDIYNRFYDWTINLE